MASNDYENNVIEIQQSMVRMPLRNDALVLSCFINKIKSTGQLTNASQKLTKGEAVLK